MRSLTIFNILSIFISSQLHISVSLFGPLPNNLTSSTIIIASSVWLDIIVVNSSYKGQSFIPLPVSPALQWPSKNMIDLSLIFALSSIFDLSSISIIVFLHKRFNGGASISIPDSDDYYPLDVFIDVFDGEELTRLNLYIWRGFGLTW